MYCAEEELASLVNKALEYNQSLDELKEALVQESWEGIDPNINYNVFLLFCIYCFFQSID